MFPVPDGDTGTNMLLTMRSANDEVARWNDCQTVSEVAAALAKGTLLGARGNSGVILSQFFQGLSQGLQGKETCDVLSLVGALELARKAAYNAVGKPVEGTILTVVRAMSEEAANFTFKDSVDILQVWEACLKAARKALRRTPSLLPVLKLAGVVDAGGQGFVIIWEGALASLKGRQVERLKFKLCAPTDGKAQISAQISQEFFEATEHAHYGFCTQFLITGVGLDPEVVRQRMSSMADSSVVVGTSDVIKVHVHTADPQKLVSEASSFGAVTELRVENIDKQHRAFRESHQHGIEVKTGVLAVAWGEGFAQVFKDLGAMHIVSCGQTMNPSAAELLESIDAVGATEIIVLPNNSNVVPVANQAATMAKKKVHVVPSHTLPQGVAATLAFNSEETTERNLRAMQAAIGDIKTIEVTRAVRATELGGAQVKEGRFISLLDGELDEAGESPVQVLSATLQKLAPTAGQVVTLYRGKGVSEADAAQVADFTHARFQGVELQMVYGGQPLYQYIASLE